MTTGLSSNAARRLSWPPSSADLEGLRKVLAMGGVLAIPTESSYALAADPRNREGVAAVYRLKGRGWNKPLPVGGASLLQLEALGVKVPPGARLMLEALWPARLTVVLPLTNTVPAASGGNTLAVRVPEHPELCQLLEHLGPLTVTSANHSGEEPVLTAEEAARVLDGSGTIISTDAIVLDAGTLPGGPPSTLVRWRGWERGEIGPWDVLRRGAFDPYRLLAGKSRGNQ